MDKQIHDALQAKQAGIVATLELVEREADLEEAERQRERLTAKLKNYREYLAAHNLAHETASSSEFRTVVERLLAGNQDAAVRHLDWMRRQARRHAQARVLCLIPPQVLLPKEKQLVADLLAAVDDAERERLEFAQSQAAAHYERTGVIPSFPVQQHY